MKKIIVFFLLISSLSYSQFNIRGTMSPTENSSWVLLYKIEGTKQIFVKNTQVKKEAEKGFFEFSLPNEAKPGTYRIKYSMKRNGFIDFFFNKEDVIFEFNPKDSNNTVIFKESIAGKGVHPHSLCPINILLKEIEESMLFIHHK